MEPSVVNWFACDYVYIRTNNGQLSGVRSESPYRCDCNPMTRRLLQHDPEAPVTQHNANCSSDACDRKPIARGLCRRHYMKQWLADQKTAMPLVPRGRIKGGRLRTEAVKAEREAARLAVETERIAARAALRTLKIQERLDVRAAQIEARKQRRTAQAEENDRRNLEKQRKSYSELGRDEKRRRKLLSKYGLTLDAFDEILVAQGCLCAICKVQLDREYDGPNKQYCPHVDHCHTSNRVRGILCRLCNLAVGYVRDNPTIARKVAFYLEGSQKPRSPANVAVRRLAQRTLDLGATP